MRRIFLVLFFLALISCEEKNKSQEDSAEAKVELQKKLKKTNLPIEVIQTEIAFLSGFIETNNSIQLRYELTLLNNFKIPFTLKKVEIYDLQKDSEPIAVFDVNYLDKNFDRPGNNDLEDVKLLSANEFGVLNIQLDLKLKQTVPNKIFHKLYFQRQKRNWEFAMHPMEVAILKIPEKNKLTLGLPFKKKGKWLYEADSHQGARFLTEGSATYPQRFAIDWTLINENGFFAKGDTKINKNWETHGIEILSVADGKVVAIKDGIAENEPLSKKMAVRITRETIGGNYVIVDIGNDVYAFYGHLIPNSLRVKVGDVVKKGQVMGLLGNSGNSDAPHLHFHLETKSKYAFGGEGIPYHIEQYTHLKDYSEREIIAMFDNNTVELEGIIPVQKNSTLPIGYGLIELK